MSPIQLSNVKQQFEKFAASQPTLLTIYLTNVTAYYQDTVDLTLLATTVPAAPITANLAKNNFFPLEVVGDIVQINDDKTVKGLYLSKNLVTKSSPTAPTGTMISDTLITGFRHDIFKILYPDPAATTMTLEIGSITAAGVSGQPVAPGGPQEIVGGDWAITGGTGAFLGLTGQMGGQGAAGGAIRAASVKEDPSLRRANASPNDIATMFLYVIAMMPPQVIEVFHAASGNQPPTPVTQGHPAKGGDSLILYATGLGPVHHRSGNAWVEVPIGQPFPANATVVSPVTVTIGNVGGGNTTIAPTSARGFAGFSNGYVVEFSIPHGFSSLSSTEATSIQISSAWIQSAVWTLYVH